MCKRDFRIVTSEFYYSSALFWRTDRCRSPIIWGEKWENRGIMPLFRKIPIRNARNHHLQLLRSTRMHQRAHTQEDIRKISIGRSHRVRCKSSSRARWKLNDTRRDCSISRVSSRDTHVKNSPAHRETSRSFRAEWKLSRTRRDWGSHERSPLISVISSNTSRFIILPMFVLSFAP